MALIRPISGASGTATALTASNINTGNSYSFDLTGVKVGSIIAINFGFNTTNTTNFMSDTPTVTGATVIENSLMGYLNSTCFMLVKATSSTVTVSGSKPNSIAFTLKAYEIA